jgi:hypothetical protein
VVPPAPTRRTSRRASIGLVGLALTVPGCFLAARGPDRPDPGALAGTPVYVERCAGCHAARVSNNYTVSAHAAAGLRCGQCHRGEGHPDFVRPVEDGTCGGCHQAEYQQTGRSKHFVTRTLRPLNMDRTARAGLRRDAFIVRENAAAHFVGDAAAGQRGGRLCAACHYDEHRLGVAAVGRVAFCTGCHAGRDEHYPMATAGATNRCVACHVRVGETLSGQTVNTHRFAMPGVAIGAR